MLHTTIIKWMHCVVAVCLFLATVSMWHLSIPQKFCVKAAAFCLQRVVKIKVSFACKAAVSHIEQANVCVLSWLWKRLAVECICQTERRNEHWEWSVPPCVLMKWWINPLSTVKRHPDAATRFTCRHDGASLIYASSKLGLYKHAPCASSHQGILGWNVILCENRGSQTWRKFSTDGCWSHLTNTS